jgi:DNA replication protein DnaC
LTEAALLAETTGWYTDGEARLGLCAVCPPDGGACAREVSLLAPGEKPEWKDQRLVATRCSRFAEWRLSERLGVSNVPERYRSAKMSEFVVDRQDWITHQRQQQAGFNAVASFFEALQAGSEPWLVLCGPSNSGKTHLACAMLRGVPKKLPRKRFWYADMNELRMAVKAFQYDSGEEDPIRRLRVTELLVLENLDASRLAKEAYVRDRIEEVLYQRWNRRRATMITTHGRAADLAEMFPAITTLQEAPSCSLA